MGGSMKSRKVSHVSGHSGTSLQEISSIAAVPVLLLLLLRCGPWSGLETSWNPVARQALAWLLFVPAQLAVQLDLITAQSLLLATAAAVLCLWALQPGRGGAAAAPQQLPTPPAQQLRDAITHFRASLLIITCAAILAVDFHAFPRRFAKAETYGAGLMDAGVGCFVLASAIPAGVAAASRGSMAAPRVVRKELARVAVLAALGLGRAVATHSLDYQNHVGEYGVHWNFFLTLAVLRLANVALGQAASSTAAAAGLGGAVLAIHQGLLSWGGLVEYVHSAGPRTNLAEANKEGLLSLPGYLALHWLGLALGRCLHAAVGAGPQQQQQQQRRRQQQVGGAAVAKQVDAAGAAAAAAAAAAGPCWAAMARVAAADGALWLACWAATTNVQPISRRACNLAYVLWMLALGLQCVALFLAVSRWQPGPVPVLLQRLNCNMLAVFLAANILTGLVNMACDTLAVGWVGAAAILLVYMTAISFSASELG